MVPPPRVIDPREALDLLTDAHAISTPSRPLLIVEADGSATFERLTRLARTRPCVLAAVGDGRRPPSFADLALTDAIDPPAPWVGGDVASRLRDLASAVDAHPEAVVALVQLLRMSARLDADDALVAESLCYGLLQGGTDHLAWLARRSKPSPRSAADEPVIARREGDTLFVVLNRPEVRNALNVAMRDALAQTLQVAVVDPTITRVDVRGAGPAFCSGGDLTEFGSGPNPVCRHLIRSARGPAAWFAALGERMTAHVHGPSAGAGVELAAFAGRVVASADATFRLPELSMGLIPGSGGTVSVPRRIGRPRATWLILAGERLDASTAVRWGLVDELR